MARLHGATTTPGRIPKFRLYSACLALAVSVSLVALVALTGPACLVVSLQPAYNDNSITLGSDARRLLEKR